MDDAKTEDKDFTKAEFMEEADRLLIENFYLKLQNLQLQGQGLDRQKEDLIEDIKKTQQKMVEGLANLSKKYGVTLSQRSIDRDGRIMRRPQPTPDLSAPHPPDLTVAAQPKN
jgi:hypothetical protein